MSGRKRGFSWSPATLALINAGGSLVEIAETMDPPVGGTYVSRCFSGLDKFSTRVYDTLVELHGEQVAKNIKALAAVSRKEAFEKGTALGRRDV